MERNTLYLRTDRAIIDALIRLLKERSFEKITVQNILDETPVTRATFYAHFHDKYEVAERMQEMYVQILHEIPLQMTDMDRTQYPKLIRRSLARHGELLQALTQIHTDRVDIRSVTAKMHREHYLSRKGKEDAEDEADIYAQAMTALQMAYLKGDDRALKDEDYYDHVMVEVFLHILHLEEDRALQKQIFDKLPGKRFR